MLTLIFSIALVYISSQPIKCLDMFEHAHFMPIMPSVKRYGTKFNLRNSTTKFIDSNGTVLTIVLESGPNQKKQVCDKKLLLLGHLRITVSKSNRHQVKHYK